MKPEPVPTRVQCAACGLPWQDHKPNRGKVTLSECVRLLKDRLARQPNITWTNNALAANTSKVIDFGGGQAKTA